LHENEWIYCKPLQQNGKIIEVIKLWNTTQYRIWLPLENHIKLFTAEQIAPIETYDSHNSSEKIAYIVSAARIVDAITHDILLAPINSTVIPLSHQIRALSKAVEGDQIRYLLADEVGLGKTIEAGLILKELKLRGLVKRTLVIAPRGLLTQWMAEMKVHFHEDFKIIIPSEFPSYNKKYQNENIWKFYNQIICPIDSVKPLEKRKGWSIEKIKLYNKERLNDLIIANWDLIIVDEAHRLAGSTERVARYKLGKELANAAPYILLLTATPHQGKTDSFYRLISLLDKKAFPNIDSLNKERVAPYVVRTEKREAIDNSGNPLFKPRYSKLISIYWTNKYIHQKQLYDAVTEYVRKGYNRAIKEKKNYIGFLMSLMQRLVTSSTRAISMTLSRRLEMLEKANEQLNFYPLISEEEWSDYDGQYQIESIIQSTFKALENEREEVKILLEKAKYAESLTPDAKADALLEWLYKLQSEESNHNLKFLIFTEFIPTQTMLEQFLRERGFSVVCLNGSMNMEERIEAQEQFANDKQILISTEAGEKD